MRRPVRSVLFLTATIALLTFFVFWTSDFGLRAEPVEKGKEDPRPAMAKLQRGMTPEQVRERLGAPNRIARQILYHRYLEQWIYDLPSPVRVQFDCPRGQKPQLVWKR